MERLTVLALTWIAYASYYLCRKQLAVTKTTLADQFHLSLQDLGAIDTGYLAAYAAGMFASGLLCDAVGPRRLIGAGMLLAAGATAWFGVSSSSTVFAISFGLNGLFQSTGWPGCIKATTPWLAPAERGRIMGIWSTCYQVGGLMATALATRLLAVWGWRSTFLVPAAFTGAVGVAVWLSLRERSAPTTEKALTSRDVLANPLVWTLGAAYFCLKLMRYSLLFWLPFFLNKQLGYDKSASGYLSISFELGGVFGAVAIGWLSDRLPRGVVLVAMVLGLGAALEVYGTVASMGQVINFVSMAVVGFMLYGPDALVCSVAAQDLGGSGAAGTAAGVINGVGSVGAIAQGMLTAHIADHYGWDTLFRTFMWMSFGCAILLLPYAYSRRKR